MPEPAWLVFDLGGVLFDFDGAAGVSELTGMSATAAHDALVGSAAVRALETGEIDAPAFGQRFADELGLPLSAGEMVEIWASWEAGPKPGAVELLAGLRQRIPVACLTNNNAIHWHRLSTRYDADSLFDRCYLSHEIGLHKPDPRIFHHVVVDLAARPAEIVYFDDRDDIVESAAACGLNAHQVAGPDDIRAVLADV